MRIQLNYFINIKTYKKMRRITPLIILILTMFVFGSANGQSKWNVPTYTNVKKISELKPGMTITQVNSKLGIQPYNMYMTDENNNTIVLYNYRTVERKIVVDNDVRQHTQGNESSQTKGDVWYSSTSSTIYVLFADNKMKSLISDKGREEVEYIIIQDNTIRFIAKNDISSIYQANVVKVEQKKVKKKKEVEEPEQEAEIIVVKQKKVVEKDRKYSGFSEIGGRFIFGDYIGGGLKYKRAYLLKQGGKSYLGYSLRYNIVSGSNFNYYTYTSNTEMRFLFGASLTYDYFLINKGGFRPFVGASIGPAFGRSIIYDIWGNTESEQAVGQFDLDLTVGTKLGGSFFIDYTLTLTNPQHMITLGFMFNKYKRNK